MREILFRAKRKDNGEWVEGYFVNLWMKHRNRYDPLITTDECSHNIVPETVCEYTGLIDRNNKKIFEDDIIKDHKNGEVGRVVFHNGSWMVWGYDVELYEKFLSNLCSINYSKSFGRFVRGEVIGNIHDNKNRIPVMRRENCLKNSKR